MKKKKALDIKHFPERDEVQIAGISYAGDLFRQFGGVMPVGSSFRLLKRENKVLTIEKIDMSRIRVGPMTLNCKKCGAADDFTLDIQNPNTNPPVAA